jgi:hypothetical protein
MNATNLFESPAEPCVRVLPSSLDQPPLSSTSSGTSSSTLSGTLSDTSSDHPSHSSRSELPDSPVPAVPQSAEGGRVRPNSDEGGSAKFKNPAMSGVSSLFARSRRRQEALSFRLRLESAPLSGPTNGSKDQSLLASAATLCRIQMEKPVKTVSAVSVRRPHHWKRGVNERNRGGSHNLVLLPTSCFRFYSVPGLAGWLPPDLSAPHPPRPHVQ